MLYYYSNELEVNVITGSLALESLFLILTFTLKLTSEEKVLKSQRHDFTFLTVNVAFIRQFIVILGLMPITVILCREHSC
jgi:galactokinase